MSLNDYLSSYLSSMYDDSTEADTSPDDVLASERYSALLQDYDTPAARPEDVAGLPDDHPSLDTGVDINESYEGAI
jgi:hypothetical protein